MDHLSWSDWFWGILGIWLIVGFINEYRLDLIRKRKQGGRTDYEINRHHDY